MSSSNCCLLCGATYSGHRSAVSKWIELNGHWACPGCVRDVWRDTEDDLHMFYERLDKCTLRSRHETQDFWWHLSEAMAKKSDDVIMNYGSSEGTDSGSSEENADVIMDDWEDL